MKTKLLILFMLLTVCCGTSVSQVRFQFYDGIYDEALKAKMESNISRLLSEINNAEQGKRALLLSSINMTEPAKTGLQNLWNAIRFKCEWNANVQSCLRETLGYQVRQIAIEIKPIDNEYRGELHKELTISLDKRGTITGVRIALDNHSYSGTIRNGVNVTDVRRRNQLISFVEDFRSYYVEKDTAALNKIFSDDAVIITGRIIKPAEKVNIEVNNAKKKVIYNKQSKKQYLRNLRNLFKNTKYIQVDFSDIEIIRHGSLDYVYGVRLRQKWDSQRYSGSRYSDDGHVFLLWNLKDEENPKIYVRSWTPYDNELTDEELGHPEDFSY